MSRQLSFALALLACGTTIGATEVFAGPSELTQLAQAQTEPSQPAAPTAAAPDPATPDATAADAPEEPIGNVATVTGSASVIRNDKTTPLKVKDDIYLNDVVQTGANSALGITFIDATTFNLKASTKITIDNYVYEDGGKSNAAIFDVAKGTAAFVAASVAKTGDMKITTPTATLGIRGTTGLVEVPEGAAANNPNNVAVKLYPDADGRVGRIEVNDRAGARLGFLTQGASGFRHFDETGGAPNAERRRRCRNFHVAGFCHRRGDESSRTLGYVEDRGVALAAVLIDVIVDGRVRARLEIKRGGVDEGDAERGIRSRLHHVIEIDVVLDLERRGLVVADHAGAAGHGPRHCRSAPRARPWLLRPAWQDLVAAVPSSRRSRNGACLRQLHQFGLACQNFGRPDRRCRGRRRQFKGKLARHRGFRSQGKAKGAGFRFQRHPAECGMNAAFDVTGGRGFGQAPPPGYRDTRSASTI